MLAFARNTEHIPVSPPPGAPVATVTSSLLADALRPVLARDLKTARRLAEEEQAQADSDLDREIASKTLESLGR